MMGARALTWGFRFCGFATYLQRVCGRSIERQQEDHAAATHRRVAAAAKNERSRSQVVSGQAEAALRPQH